MTPLAKQVLDHLEEERGVIAKGAYAGLTELGAQKEALFKRLSQTPASPDILSLIGIRAKRNLRLLEAAMRGIKDASNRLRDQKAVQAGFETYGADGQRTAHPAKRPAFERKA